MDTKYYAPKEHLSVLTVSRSPGNLTYSDILDNLMRMILMDETEERERLSAEEAIAEIAEISREEYRALRNKAVHAYQDWDLQKYMEEHEIREGMPLVPVEEIFQEENEPKVTPEEVEAWTLETLDEFSWTELENMWLSGSPVRE